MREILFKAKRLDNGEWVEGYLVKYPSAIQVGDCSPWYIQVPPVDPDDSGGKYNVDPSTVCEWTGLKDKNGKRIFEGDILSYNCGDGDDEPREVHFMNGRFVVQWAVRGDIDDKPYQTIRMAKVIGSIHDGEGRND